MASEATATIATAPMYWQAGDRRLKRMSERAAVTVSGTKCGAISFTQTFTHQGASP
jgi:hypothetical protein